MGRSIYAQRARYVLLRSPKGTKRRPKGKASLAVQERDVIYSPEALWLSHITVSSALPKPKGRKAIYAQRALAVLSCAPLWAFREKSRISVCFRPFGGRFAIYARRASSLPLCFRPQRGAKPTTQSGTQYMPKGATLPFGDGKNQRQRGPSGPSGPLRLLCQYITSLSVVGFAEPKGSTARLALPFGRLALSCILRSRTKGKTKWARRAYIERSGVLLRKKEGGAYIADEYNAPSGRNICPKGPRCKGPSL